jgi:hypothetical protein
MQAQLQGSMAGFFSCRGFVFEWPVARKSPFSQKVFLYFSKKIFKKLAMAEENPIFNTDLEKMIASLGSKTLFSEKRKIEMVADLLKPIDVERNAALEAEIVKLHLKSQEPKVESCKHQIVS